MMTECSEEEQDILREIGNIGGGNALTSLSMMLDQTLELEVPKCRIVKEDLAGQLLEHPTSLYAGVAMSMTGTIDCMLALLLNREFTTTIIKALDDEPVFDVRSLSDMQKSALCEVGNIMGNSYVTAVGSLLGARIIVSVPHIIIDTGERVLGSFLDHYAVKSSDFLFINNSFKTRDRELESYMLLCPTAESLTTILGKLNM